MLCTSAPNQPYASLSTASSAACFASSPKLHCCVVAPDLSPSQGNFLLLGVRPLAVLPEALSHLHHMLACSCNPPTKAAPWGQPTGHVFCTLCDESALPYTCLCHVTRCGRSSQAVKSVTNVSMCAQALHPSPYHHSIRNGANISLFYVAIRYLH